MNKRLWAAAALALFASVATGRSAVLAQLELSMQVTGSIDIELDGSVSGHSIDKADQLPPGIAHYLDTAVSSWTFEPVLVDDQPAPVRASMRLRITAQDVGTKYPELSISSAHFGDHDPEEYPTFRSTKPPRYPQAALQNRIGGDVYLAIRVGRDGRVEDIVAEQVNLRTAVPESRRDRVRNVLADAAINAARNWTFNPPSRGDDVDAPHWDVISPVNFRFPDFHPHAEYGQWDAYLPGPRQPVPWRNIEDPAGTPDAFMAEGVYPMRSRGPQLLTALGKS